MTISCFFYIKAGNIFKKCIFLTIIKRKYLNKKPPKKHCFDNESSDRGIENWNILIFGVRMKRRMKKMIAVLFLWGTELLGEMHESRITDRVVERTLEEDLTC